MTRRRIKIFRAGPASVSSVDEQADAWFATNDVAVEKFEVWIHATDLREYLMVYYMLSDTAP